VEKEEHEQAVDKFNQVKEAIEEKHNQVMEEKVEKHEQVVDKVNKANEIRDSIKDAKAARNSTQAEIAEADDVSADMAVLSLSSAFTAKMESCDWDMYLSKCVGLTSYPEYARCGTTVGCGAGINFSGSYLAVGPGSVQAPLPCSTTCTSLCEQTYSLDKALFASCHTQTCGCML